MELRNFIYIVSTIAMSVQSHSIYGPLLLAYEPRAVNNAKTSPPIAALMGGQTAQLNQFPWMVAVHQLLKDRKVSHCGGSIISPRWVLTAAHCLAGFNSYNPMRIVVIFGMVRQGKINYNSYVGPGEVMIAEDAVIHPNYTHTAYEVLNDIALLYMPKNILFGPAIQPIQLAGAAHAHKTSMDNPAIVTGWGATGPFETKSEYLQWAEVSMITNKQCSRHWRVGTSHICNEAGINPHMCRGDSGGPLVMRSSDNNNDVQIGVVSHGQMDRACPSTKPIVSTRVSSFIKWIGDETGIEF